MPKVRPAEYQPVSAMIDATTPTPTSCHSGVPPVAASAPATISVGYAGRGSPACNARTLTNTKPKPYSCNSAIRWLMKLPATR